MKKKAERAKKRQKDRWGSGPKLVPNYNGKLYESWDEVKSVANNDKKKND